MNNEELKALAGLSENDEITEVTSEITVDFKYLGIECRATISDALIPGGDMRVCYQALESRHVSTKKESDTLANLHGRIKSSMAVIARENAVFEKMTAEVKANFPAANISGFGVYGSEPSADFMMSGCIRCAARFFSETEKEKPHYSYYFYEPVNLSYEEEKETGILAIKRRDLSLDELKANVQAYAKALSSYFSRVSEFGGVRP